MPLDEKILTYIREESARGVSRDTIAAELVKAGWKKDDVEEGLGHMLPPHEQTAASTPIRSSATMSRIWKFGVPILFGISMLGGVVQPVSRYMSQYFLMSWYLASALGILIVLGHVLAAIIHAIRHDGTWSIYLKRAIGLLFAFIVIGFGTCLVNLQGVNI